MSRSVGRIVGAAVFAVAGFFTGGWGWAAGAAVLGGMYGDYVARQMGRVGDQGNEPQSQTVRSSKAPVRYILGRASTGGVLTWAQEEAGDQDEGEWLHMVYTLSEGSIDGLEDVLINKERVGSVGQNIKMELVRDADTPNGFLIQNSPDWRASMVGRGLSWMRVSLKFDPEVFPSGIPEAQFIVRGRTDIYDPRTGEYGYTDNVALCALWYLRNVCEVPDDEIVFDSFASAANVCDEEVENPDGTFSKRYTMGAVIGDDEDRTAVLDKMMSACAGKLLRIGGRWMMQAGAYYGPEEFEITEDMVIGAVSGSVEVDNDSAINTVTGTFTDPSQAWTETDFPPLVNQAWLAEDGAELAESMQIRYVTDPYQAQRLASIRLRQRRNGGELSLPMNFNGYNCRPGRAVRLNLPSLNIDGEFIVTDWSMSSDQGCNVTLSAYGAETFDDAVGEPYSPGGFISLPTGGMDAPTNLQFEISNDPMVKQGTVSWSPPDQPVQYYGIVIRNSQGDAVQTYQVPPASSSCDIQGLSEGQFTIIIYARGESGRSGEAAIIIDLVVPAVPEQLNLSARNFEITSEPYMPSIGFGTTYQFDIVIGDGEGHIPIPRLQGMYAVFAGLNPDTLHTIFARSINPLGVSEWVSESISTLLDVSQVADLIEDLLADSPIFDDVIDELRDRVEGVRDRITTTRETFLDNVNDILDNAFETKERKTGIRRVEEEIREESEQRVSQVEQITAVLDDEITTREAQITTLNQVIADETSARAQAIQLVEASISDEASARQADVFTLNEAIIDESTARASAITNVNARIATAEGEISANALLVQDVIIDPFGTSSALGALNTSVSNLSGDVAEANLILESIYDAGSDELIARGALTVDANGRTTGIVLQSGGGPSTIEMQGDVMRWLRANGSIAVQYDTQADDFVFDGRVVAESGRIGGWTIGGDSLFSLQSGIRAIELDSAVPQIILRNMIDGQPAVVGQLSPVTFRAGDINSTDYIHWGANRGLSISGTIDVVNNGQRIIISPSGAYSIWIGPNGVTPSDTNGDFWINNSGDGFLRGEFFQGEIIESKVASGNISGGSPWAVTANGHQSKGLGVKVDFEAEFNSAFAGDWSNQAVSLVATIRRNGTVIGTRTIPAPPRLYDSLSDQTVINISGSGFIVDNRTVEESRNYQLQISLNAAGASFSNTSGGLSITTFENLLPS